MSLDLPVYLWGLLSVFSFCYGSCTQLLIVVDQGAVSSKRENSNDLCHSSLTIQNTSKTTFQKFESLFENSRTNVDINEKSLEF